MKSIKNHISLILPLFIMFFSFHIITILDRTLKEYEKELLKDYNIVIVASKELDLSSIVKESKDIGIIKTVDIDRVLDDLNMNLTDLNTTILKNSLPFFYTVKLTKFLSKEEVNRLKEKLSANKNIERVEEFKEAHDLIHKFLILTRAIIFIFTAFILLISFLLILKQIEIWIFEHSQRIGIMELFGAPFLMKSAILYRLMIIDSLLSIIGVSFLLQYLMDKKEIVDFYNSLGLKIPLYNTFNDIFTLILFSIFLTLISVTYTLIRHKRDIEYA